MEFTAFLIALAGVYFLITGNGMGMLACAAGLAIIAILANKRKRDRLNKNK